MTSQDLLGALRPVYVLAEKPGITEDDSKRYWSIKLGGLHQEHLKSAVAHLRKREKKSVQTKSQKRGLKSTELQDSLAQALGAKSYEHWLAHEQPKIIDFLVQHDLERPADLIKWASPPGFAGALQARQISDRIFNSKLPLPKRIFTGVGCYLFASSGYGRLDIDAAAGRSFGTDEERYIFCRTCADAVLLRAVHMRGTDGPAYLELTARMLMLNAVSEYIGCMYNLLGSNLVDSMSGDPVMRSYNSTMEERAFELKLFELFREEIERSNAGWVEVLAVPANQNLVFLKGPRGSFDWVVRDQRDVMMSSNPIHPFFMKSELPTAMDTSQFTAHLYFTRGGWQEKLENVAENSYYERGGTTANWPGYEKLIERELVLSHHSVLPKRISGQASTEFVSHRINKYRLMISPLITIDQFMAFLTETDWGRTRLENADKAKIDLERDLMSVNAGDAGHLPVSVTWLDAVAYCRYYEQRHGLPVRLLESEEWQQIAPAPSVDRSQARQVRVRAAKSGKMPDDPIYEQLDWAVVGGDGKLGENSSHCYRPDGILSFGSSLHWTWNSEGLRFLSVAGFCEWLSGYQDGHVPYAEAGRGILNVGAGFFGSLEPAHLAMRHKGAKVGFRLCYVAHPDA